MTAMSENLNIAWAIDPMTKKEGLVAATAKTLKSFIRGIPTKIQPIYVAPTLPIFEGDVPLAIEHERRWKIKSRQKLKMALRNIQLKGLLKPQVLVDANPSTMGLVSSLLKFSEKTHADLICLATHGRKGLSRAFMGSFAETLMVTSTHPLLVIPSHAQPHKKISKILFPTDFSPNSRKAFERVLGLAQTLKASVFVFHHMIHPIDPIIQSSSLLLGGGWIGLNQYYDDYQSQIETTAKGWQKEAELRDVECEYSIVKSLDSIADSIIKTAKRRHCDLIAMYSQRGMVSAPLLGSVTRQVIRSTQLPIWTLNKKMLQN